MLNLNKGALKRILPQVVSLYILNLILIHVIILFQGNFVGAKAVTNTDEDDGDNYIIFSMVWFLSFISTFVLY